LNSDKKRLAVLASGSGSNLQAIIENCQNGYIPAEVAVVLSNNTSAYAIERAKNFNIATVVLETKDFDSREAYDKKVVEILKSYEIDLVVLAGYMLLVTSEFLKGFQGRIMNIHPALLPAFAGTDGIGDALTYGAKVAGVTVHFVDEGCDTGPIILQDCLKIKEGETKEELAKRIHTIEHRLYPEAIKLFCEGRLEVEGRTVKLKS